ncbi:hypothetical protein [Saccharopolyspora griseoalba]|uniref:Uncharacterized protein n=1 Tax=Saccharopolyspora griseoalba TaxID=1431848 RepID=A0ABW2LK55_9PSEU
MLVAAAEQRVIDVGPDICWRDLRAHSQHDPVACKRLEVGRNALLGELPEPTWYP